MRYQKVETQIWNDEKFSLLPAHEKYLFLYLLTSPHSNCLGAFVMKPGYAADDMGWERQQYLETLSQLSAKGFVTVDQTLSLIVLTKFLKHNPPENPNQFKAATKVLVSLPKSSALNPSIHILQGIAERFNKPLPEGFDKPFAKPETEAEAETEAETEEIKPPPESPVKVIERGEAPPVEEKAGGEGAARQERLPVSEGQRLVQRYLGRLQASGGEVATLQEVCGRYTPERIREAFEAAGAAGATKLSWVKTWLENPKNQARASPAVEISAEEACERNRMAAREFCGVGG